MSLAKGVPGFDDEEEEGGGLADDAEQVGRIAEKALSEYVPAEGARSLYRSVGTILMEGGL